MTTINNASLLSGLAVQQKYGTAGPVADRADRGRFRTTVMPSGDTVEISSEAWALFRAQTSGDDTGTRSAAEAGGRASAQENTSDGAAEPSGNRVGVQDQISQLETEINGLEGEIAALGETAETDELAAALLRSKTARLQLLQAKLTGLLAKSFQLA